MIPGQLGPTSRDLLWLLSALMTLHRFQGPQQAGRESAYLHLVCLGDALRDADNEPNLVLDGLEDGVCRGGRRDVEHGRVGLRLPYSLNDKDFSATL